jgi:hypothetical protein
VEERVDVARRPVSTQEGEMSDRVVRAFPILPGKENELRDLATELAGTRRADTSRFYQHYGVLRESWHLQRMADGQLLLLNVTDLDSRPVDEAAREYGSSKQPFEAWLKECVKKVSGVDLDAQPLGAPSDCVFDWPQS